MYKIRYIAGLCTEDDDGRTTMQYGNVQHGPAVIQINADNALSVQKLSLMHEFLHCCFAMGGSRVVNVEDGLKKGYDAEEFTVSMLEHPMFTLLTHKKNRAVLEWMSC